MWCWQLAPHPPWYNNTRRGGGGCPAFCRFAALLSTPHQTTGIHPTCRHTRLEKLRTLSPLPRLCSSTSAPSPTTGALLPSSGPCRRCRAGVSLCHPALPSSPARAQGRLLQAGSQEGSGAGQALGARPCWLRRHAVPLPGARCAALHAVAAARPAPAPAAAHSRRPPARPPTPCPSRRPRRSTGVRRLAGAAPHPSARQCQRDPGPGRGGRHDQRSGLHRCCHGYGSTGYRPCLPLPCGSAREQLPAVPSAPCLRASPACPPVARRRPAAHPAPAEALGAAQQLAAAHGCIVAVSGPEDLVTDGRRVLRACNGVPLLQQITATGCSGAGVGRLEAKACLCGLGRGSRGACAVHPCGVRPALPCSPLCRAVTAVAAAFVSLFPQQPLEATAHALAYFG